MITNTPIPLFLFYLVNSAGMCYYIDGNGNLRTTGQPTPLEYSPDGWEGIAIGWERNLAKFGLIRNFSISLGFYGDGRLVLEKLYNSTNVDEKVWLLVQRLDVEVTADDYALVHKFYYKGEIDLSTYRKSRRKATVNIMEGGRSKEIRANENQIYQIALSTDPDKIRVLMDGVALEQNARYAVAGPVSNALVLDRHTVPMGFIDSEGTSFGVAFFSQELQSIPSLVPYAAGSTNYFMENAGTVPITFRLHGDIAFTCTKNTINAALRLDLVRSTNGIPIQIYSTINAMINGQTYTAAIDQTITVPAGEKLFLSAQFFGAFSGGSVEAAVDYSNDNRLSLSFSSRKPASFIWAFKGFDLWKRLIERACGSRDFAVSELLESTGFCYTSGDAVRSIDGSFIKTTLSNFVTDVSVRKSAGLGVEGQNVVLERRIHFMNDDVVIHLGTAKTEPEVAPAVDIMFTTLKLGYNDPKIEGINGKYAFNDYKEYSTKALRVAKVFELICPYPSDPFLIEQIRINLEGKLTTDGSSDNETLFLNVDLDNPQVDADGTYYLLKRAAYTSVTGVPNPDSLFNIEESTPQRILNEWASYIRGCLQGYEATVLKFESSTKNKDLVTMGGPGGTITESASRAVGLLDAPFFQNDKLTVTVVASADVFRQISATPSACFSFTWNNIIFKGWLLKGSVQSKTSNEQQFILLSHPDNDLTLLENG